MSTRKFYTQPPNLTPSQFPLPPFLPLCPPPQTPPPTLPRRPKLSPPQGFTSTSYSVPAAYPRSTPDSTGTLHRFSEPFQLTPPKEWESKEERRARLNEEALEVARKRYHTRRWGIEEALTAKPPGLWLAVERWRRDEVEDGEGLTLVMAHANGFLKEDWHPTLHRLLAKSPPSQSSIFGESPFPVLPLNPDRRVTPLPSTTRIDDIYLLDDVIHASSLDLNKGKLGPVHLWSDRGRDIINFIEHILPTFSEGVPSWGLALPKGRKPKVIGVGHSLGGNAMIQAAAYRPDLFHAMFLLDPMAPPIYIDTQQEPSDLAAWPLLTLSVSRRSIWPSRQSAVEHALKSNFFKRYHPEVLEIWKSHALVSLPPTYASHSSLTPSGTPTTEGTSSTSEAASSATTVTNTASMTAEEKPTEEEEDGPVTLATPPWCEATSFAESTGLAEGWELLPKVTIPAGFLMAGDSRTTYGDDITREMVYRAPISRNEKVIGSSHQILQERPDDIADALWRFIGNVIFAQSSERKMERAKL
ncbi:hypothetical protein TREMEDRAFT_59699 [Tremella mesenterica DSM 1558]|uniref:uncharacterized protein n=1 Tax=Tremella mesenterica (strain ATCC 24925 / CBS 8224 / DSM 1558 / NBRC 9311 / NRRL Y-6157 / RJB 2259-6 / UBC 559-6) TaxID=578456 RepID=UPI0003F49163|nr:uncharacterized protein TREMEDRAFT_59699 [Tremella mesenterica DSM 1558]EIW73526.1 hypothetical protein TREMEDRAFT_59699 [Tremella mesenterica DSM 1558]